MPGEFDIVTLLTCLVRDGAVVIENLEDLGLGQGFVPFTDFVSVTHGLYQELGWHLNLSLTPVDLSSLPVLTTFHDISLRIRVSSYTQL